MRNGNRESRTTLPVVSRVCAVGVFVLGAAVLTGWGLELEAVKRVLPGHVAMNPLTAVLFLLSSRSLWVLASGMGAGWGRRSAAASAWVVLGVGIFRLLDWAWGLGTGLDQALFRAAVSEGEAGLPNRMAANTALGFACLGGALLLAHRSGGRPHPVGAVLNLVPAFTGMLALIGHVNGVRSLLGTESSLPMAAHTAAGLMVMSVGVLCATVWGPDASATDPGRSLRRSITVGFAAALFAVSTIAVASYNSLRQLVEDQRSNIDAIHALTSAATLASLLKDTETAARGYVITGAEPYLDPYRQARRRISTEVRRLRVLTAGVSGQGGRIDRLEPLIAERVRLLERLIESRGRDGFEAAQALVMRGDGKRVMDEIRGVLAQIESGQGSWIDAGSAAVESSVRMTMGVIATGGFLTFVLVGGAGLLIRRDMAARHRTELALRESDRRLRLAVTAAESSNRAKSEFLAHMSHEIRTPLNGVIGMTELLLGTTLSAQQRRYGQLVKSSAESLTNIINDILDFSKIEAGKLDLSPTEFDLHVAVEEVIQMLAPRGQQKGLEMASHVHPDIPRVVRGDPDRIRQVLVNLLNNAIKFTARGSVVLRVTADQADASGVMARFSVTDTGVGVPAERMDRLFKAFSQADASITRTHGGTGLGLAISKRLAELMGGSVGVESEPGRGSTFWFTARLEPAASPAAARPAVDPRGLRVLAVDDSPVQREILSRQLESLGLEAAVAEDGGAALSLLRSAASSASPFRLAIVDRDMPGQDGFEFGRAVKSTPEVRETVLMILVTMEDDVDPARLRELGFAGHMTKPVRQSQLFDAIMNAIAATERPVTAAASERTPTPPPANGPRILLAEDNEVNQVVAVETLARAGYRCETVSDGRSAVEAVRLGGYDAVVMDCQMPEMDGFEASRAIRAFEGQTGRRRVPIIALTANAMKGDRERCLEAGMDAYCAKPIDPTLLVSTLRRLTRGSGVTEGGSNGAPPPSFDSEALSRWSAGDARLLTKLLDGLERQLPADLDRLERGLARGDSAALKSAAHSLKGAASMVRAVALAEEAERMERFGIEGDLERARVSLDALRSEVNRCLGDIPRARGAGVGGAEGIGRREPCAY
jgi:two-component system sensor histidine kinase/response regulator